uniref:phosphodiester glycosidase family protein n=1 Tax=Pedobacter schmidteae TaxID=2201271 RepID=UPI000EB4414D|nr:phosphodiester glycosidase family protein [Pedobacter schmidteae]
MNIKSNLVLVFIATAAFLSSCSRSKKDAGGDAAPVVPVDSTPLISLSSSWKKAVHLMGDFPDGIQVYMNTTPLNGKAFTAYCTVFDPASNLELKPLFAPVNKSVSALYKDELGFRYACINGGFFGTNVSYSLSMYNGVVDAPNIKSLSRTYNGAAATYYPTRAAFGISEDGKPEVAWVYNVGTGNSLVYAYPTPSANAINTAPKPVPTATYPAGGVIWNVKAAIGGGPMLIKDNVINVTDVQELMDIDNTSARARSAIGFTAENKIVLLAVEGGNPNGPAGLNLVELAQLMKDMGCVGAINLDGGGSTTMTVRAERTVRPSGGSERAVSTALIIRKKK